MATDFTGQCLEKLIGFHLVKKSHTLRLTARYISVFTIAHLCDLRCVKSYINCVHNLTPSFCKIDYNIFLSSTFTFHNLSPALFFWLKFVKACQYSGFIALLLEAASTSGKSVNFHQTIRRNGVENNHSQTRRRENLTPHNFRKNFHLFSVGYMSDLSRVSWFYNSIPRVE
jgi:hypothetical protein